MKLLVIKEIRLLLPAFMAAMALAIVPVWLLPYDHNNPGVIPFLLFLFGIVLLALSSFGRELGLKTLPFMLTQPLERSRIWWTKVLVLVVFVAVVFKAWSLSDNLFYNFHPTWKENVDILVLSGLLVAVFTASALWTTLLLRQVTAAFFLTFLIPMVVPVVIGITGMSVLIILAMLSLACIYAVTTFFLARWQFLHLQDTAWTGGVITFGSGRAVTEQSSDRKQRPWAALLWKELQFQQITLVGMVCLLLLHLGAITARNVGAHSFHRNTLAVLELLGLIWLSVPFLAGSQAVAEERKLGTMAAHLCLPVSRMRQWFVKLIVVFVIGGLLSAALFYGLEQMITGKKDFNDWRMVFALCMGIALAGFYGSTLTGSVVQAMAAAVLTILALWMYQNLAASSQTVFGFQLWTGSLALCTGWLAVVTTVIWLSYRNFGKVSENWRLWRRNALTLAGTVALTFGLTTAIYHRAWEFLTPLEPPHGTARLSPWKTPALHSYGGQGLTAVLSDGKLWVDRLNYVPRRIFRGFCWGEIRINSGGNGFVPGSNWVDAVANSRETVAIRSDGTLWVSEKPQPMWTGVGLPPVEKPAGLIQFGQVTNWQNVVRHPAWAMFLLRRDGTLWHWGVISFNNKQKGPSLRDFEPQPLGQDYDWDRLLEGENWIYAYAWKKDGTAWRLCSPNAVESGKVLGQNFQFGIDVARIPPLDNNSWRSVAMLRDGSSLVTLRDDGTLWRLSWNPFSTRTSRRQGLSTNAIRASESTLVQIGTDSDWAEIYGSWVGLVARKTDGTLWKWDWDIHDDAHEVLKPLDKPPVRLGTHNDWVAVGCASGEIISLAADGNLWSWQDSWPVSLNGDTSTLLIGPSRKPTLIENIFGAQQ